MQTGKNSVTACLQGAYLAVNAVRYTYIVENNARLLLKKKRYNKAGRALTLNLKCSNCSCSFLSFLHLISIITVLHLNSSRLSAGS